MSVETFKGLKRGKNEDLIVKWVKDLTSIVDRHNETLIKLLDLIDVERKTICAWENGQRVPTFDAVCRMMETFGVDKFTIDISEPRDYSDSFPDNDTK